MYVYYGHIVINLHYVKYMRGCVWVKKLLEVMADKIRFKHYSISTEKDLCTLGKKIYTLSQ